MKNIKKTDTPEARAFWADIKEVKATVPEIPDKNLPSLGNSWWRAEKELSIELLSIKEPK